MFLSSFCYGDNLLDEMIVNKSAQSITGKYRARLIERIWNVRRRVYVIQGIHAHIYYLILIRASKVVFAFIFNYCLVCTNLLNSSEF